MKEKNSVRMFVYVWLFVMTTLLLIVFAYIYVDSQTEPTMSDKNTCSAVCEQYATSGNYTVPHRSTITADWCECVFQGRGKNFVFDLQLYKVVNEEKVMP